MSMPTGATAGKTKPHTVPQRGSWAEVGVMQRKLSWASPSEMSIPPLIHSHLLGSCATGLEHPCFFWAGASEIRWALRPPQYHLASLRLFNTASPASLLLTSSAVRLLDAPAQCMRLSHTCVLERACLPSRLSASYMPVPWQCLQACLDGSSCLGVECVCSLIVHTACLKVC